MVTHDAQPPSCTNESRDRSSKHRRANDTARAARKTCGPLELGRYLQL